MKRAMMVDGTRLLLALREAERRHKEERERLGLDPVAAAAAFVGIALASLCAWTAIVAAATWITTLMEAIR